MFGAVELVGGKRQPWRRWWSEVGFEPRLYNGILANPSDPHREFLAPGLTELWEHDATRCVVLLGEPGSGKSHELDADRQRWADQGSQVHAIDLGAHLTAEGLRAAVLRDQAVEQWAASREEELVLFLDGFDEAHEATARVAEVLAACFGELPFERLRVRITSRSSIWPDRFTDALDNLWPGSRSSIAIAPLTRDDILIAAAARSGGGEEFMRQVDDRDIAPLAARPVTLGMLLALGDEPLPDNRLDLYATATKHLAAENNVRRRQDRKVGPSIGDRVAAAELLAAATVLTGTPILERRAEPDSDGSAIALDSVLLAPVTQDQLDAVWDSALLAPAGSGKNRWAHRSIAEYLAARRLANLPLGTVQSLLADASSGLVVPQLAGTAAWTAYLNEAVWEWLAAVEPDLLVTSDLRTAPIDKRKRIARSVLAKIATGPPAHGYRSYKDLGFPGVEDDVRPLLDRAHPWWVRREILSFCHSAEVVGLDEEIVTLVEEVAKSSGADKDSDEVGLATLAALTLGQSSEPNLDQRIRTLVADSTVPIDIRGALVHPLAQRDGLLNALRLLGGTELSYPTAVRKEVAELVEPALLQPDPPWREIIEWLDEALVSDPTEPVFLHITGIAVACAVAEAGPDDALWPTVGRLAAQAISSQNSLFGWDRKQIATWPDDTRRRLAYEVVRADHEDWFSAHVLRTFGAITDEDLDYWLTLYAQALTAQDSVEEEIALAGVTAVGGPSDERVAIADSVADHLPALAEWHEDFTSEAARARWNDYQESDRDRLAKEAATEAERYFSTARLERAVVAGSWHSVVGELAKNTELHTGRVWGRPISDGPAWALVADTLRAEVIGLALGFLNAPGQPTDPHAPDDFGEALSLIDQVAQKALDDLDHQVLLNWLPLVIERNHIHGAAKGLIALLTPRYSTDVEQTLVELVRSEAPKQFTSIPHYIGDFTTPDLGDALAEEIEQSCTDRNVMAEYLLMLFDRAPETATASALRLLQERPPGPPSDDDPDAVRGWERAIGAAIAIIQTPAVTEHFDEVMACLTDSPELAEQATVYSIHKAKSGWRSLTEDQLADLYIWTHRHAPKDGTGHRLEPLRSFGSTVYNWLRERIVPEAVDAFVRIANETGEPWGLEAAQEVAARVRDQQWSPPSINELLGILEDPRRRSVRSEAQLAAVLLDAIDAVHGEIRRDPDVLSTFWEKQLGETTYIPPDERTFATRFVDRLDRHLDGVILRQECQLSLKVGDVKGTLLDIEAIVHVDGGPDAVVIIEAKGNWHRDVRTAMKDQLVDRYLTGKRTRTGIYLLAAYASSHWAPADWRLAPALRNTATVLLDVLEAQATDLSTGPTSVHSRTIDLTI